MGLCTQLCSLPLSCTYSCLSNGFPTAMCPVPRQSGAPRLPNGLGCTTMRCSLPALLGSLYLSPCWPDMSHACGVRTLLSDCEQVRTALCIAGVVLQPLAPAPGLCWGGSSGTARGGLSADAGSSTAELYMGHGEPCRGICPIPFAVAPLAGDWRASTGAGGALRSRVCPKGTAASPVPPTLHLPLPLSRFVPPSRCQMLSPVLHCLKAIGSDSAVQVNEDRSSSGLAEGHRTAGRARQQDTGPAERLAQRGAACAQHLAGKWPPHPVSGSCSQSWALQALWALALPHAWWLQWAVGSLGLGASAAAWDQPHGTAPGVVAVLGAWPGAARAWLCVQINRSHRSSGASKLLQIKQLNDTSLVLLLFFFNLTNVPKHKRGGC